MRDQKFIVLSGHVSKKNGPHAYPVFKNADCEECKLYDTVEEASREWATIKRKWPYLLVFVVALNFKTEATHFVEL